MASFGKVVSSIWSATQETSLALANLNFDFSLVKVEAPLEFHALGASLSTQRRDNAEDGALHVTARKLGALFDAVLPACPNLIKAYGRRVSEIASMPGINPQGGRDDGFFTEHIGADGTTIWAAATSGRGAIAMHLLACMLARIWKESQATSIWVELVAERKRELENLSGPSDTMELSSLAAARISLDREQLRAWDASARAWLQSADEAMTRKKVQMNLIVNNIHCPVNSHMHVYESALKALHDALTTSENLLKDMPQASYDGSVLLGLSAWHLYPNMFVLSNKSTLVDFNDKIFSEGALLTVGIKSKSPESSRGLYWSLPLAHLRYYGDAVRSSSVLSTRSSRVTFDELLQVILGSVCSSWAQQRLDLEGFIKLILLICEYPHYGPSKAEIAIPSWLRLLEKAASNFEDSKGPLRDSYTQLIRLGQRRGNFLCLTKDTPRPVFGLTSWSVIMQCMLSEDRIALLRRIAKDLATEQEIKDGHFIIRYNVTGLEKLTDRGFYEFATALPRNKKAIKRSHNGTEIMSESFIRWITKPTTGTTYGEQNISCAATCDNVCEKSCKCRKEARGCSYFCHTSRFLDLGDKFTCGAMRPRDDMTLESSINIGLARRRMRIKQTGELCLYYGENDISTEELSDDELFDWDMYEDFEGNAMLEGQTFSFIRVLGDSSTAMLFYRKDENYHSVHNYDYFVNPLAAKTILETRLLSTERLFEYLGTLGTVKVSNYRKHKNSSLTSTKHFHVTSPDSAAKQYFQIPLEARYYRSLFALAHAESIYRELRGALVDLGSTSTPFCSLRWVDGPTGSKLHRGEVLACIAFLETGKLNLSPFDLRHVMAISSGNSLFVSYRLFVDPYKNTVAFGGSVRRFVGNIGRSGLSFLIPPPKPRIRQHDDADWKLVNHTDFDGLLQDRFQETSLHLSFTEFESPVVESSTGYQDREAIFLETLVSVYENGKWVADLDPLRINESSISRHRCICSSQFSEHVEHDTDYITSGPPLTSIENWAEFLDQPRGNAIVRYC